MRPPPLSANCLIATKGDNESAQCDLSLPRRVLQRMALKKQRKKRKKGTTPNEIVPLEPTEVQRHAWPILLLDNESPSTSRVEPRNRRNRNLICVAQTGSGKTLTYCIPLVQHCAYATNNTNAGCDTCKPAVLGLVLVPTRELALQVADQLREVVRAAHREKKGDVLLDVVAIHGGVDRNDQIRPIQGKDVRKDASSGDDRRRGVILAATTGRLVDILETELGILRSTRFLVIDEADRMALSPEICSQVDKIIASMPTRTAESSEFTTCLFSATLPRNNAVQTKLSEWVGQQATTIQLHTNVLIGNASEGATLGPGMMDSDDDSESKPGKKRKKQPGPIEMASIPTNITQTLHVCSNHKKPKKLMTMLEKIRNGESKGKCRTKSLCLIFFARIKTLKYMLALLEKAGHRCAELHSGMSQREREQNVLNFKCCRTPTMLATDVAARGFHISNIRTSINYDMPSSLGEYVHRCGRAGRDKEPATVYSFFNREMKGMAPDLIDLLKSSGAWIDPNLLALVPGAGKQDNEIKRKKRRRKSTSNQSKPNEAMAGAATSEKSNNDEDENGEDIDEFSQLSGNRIILKRAPHVSDFEDCSSEEE